MTNVFLTEDHDRYIIKAVGHATGSEKVCAGVSAILSSVAGWLANNGPMLYWHAERLDEGDAEIRFAGGYIAKAVYDVAAIGLLQIEKKYPKYIKISRT